MTQTKTYQVNKPKAIFGEQYEQNNATLLINLGSPDSPVVADVASYLNTFLMDERIISLPRPLRALLVKGIITPRRAPHSAHNYSQIWDEARGTFPLIHHSMTLAEGLSQALEEPVALSMRYGHPEIQEALEALRSLPKVKHITIVPLYPHYARSSYETALAHVEDAVREMGFDGVTWDTLPPFYADKGYRQVLAESIGHYLKGGFDKLIVSFHGIPLSHLSKACRHHNGTTGYCLAHKAQHSLEEQATCYRLQTEETFQFLKEDLGLTEDQILLTYQSRLGRHPWMKPYTIDVIKELGKVAYERILIVCPGFVADCLETLHEINVENRQEYARHGGRKFIYIPCLNSSPTFISCLRDMIQRHRQTSMRHSL